MKGSKVFQKLEKSSNHLHTYIKTLFAKPFNVECIAQSDDKRV